MENLHLNDSSGQSYGYVLYETVIFGGGHLHSRDHVRDRAQVGSRGQPRLNLRQMEMQMQLQRPVQHAVRVWMMTRCSRVLCFAGVC